MVIIAEGGTVDNFYHMQPDWHNWSVFHQLFSLSHSRVFLCEKSSVVLKGFSPLENIPFPPMRDSVDERCRIQSPAGRLSLISISPVGSKVTRESWEQFMWWMHFRKGSRWECLTFLKAVICKIAPKLWQIAFTEWFNGDWTFIWNFHFLYNDNPVGSLKDMNLYYISPIRQRSHPIIHIYKAL